MHITDLKAFKEVGYVQVCNVRFLKDVRYVGEVSSAILAFSASMQLIRCPLDEIRWIKYKEAHK